MLFFEIPEFPIVLKHAKLFSQLSLFASAFGLTLHYSFYSLYISKNFLCPNFSVLISLCNCVYLYVIWTVVVMFLREFCDKYSFSADSLMWYPDCENFIFLSQWSTLNFLRVQCVTLFIVLKKSSITFIKFWTL